MKVLVIYALVPEEELRAIVDMTEEEYAFFSKAHNVYVNLGDNDEEGEEASLVINVAFSTTPEHIQYCETDMERKYHGQWKNDQLVTDLIGVDKLICSGFIL